MESKNGQSKEVTDCNTDIESKRRFAGREKNVVLSHV